jgi:hypothetical protein
VESGLSFTQSGADWRAVGLAEVGDGDGAVGAVDGGDLSFGVEVDSVAGDHLVELVGDLGDAEGPGAGDNQVDVDLAEQPLRLPVVRSQVGDLLRCSGALDGSGRHGEYRGARLGAPDEVPGLWREVEAIVRRDSVTAEGFG